MIHVSYETNERRCACREGVPTQLCVRSPALGFLWFFNVRVWVQNSNYLGGSRLDSWIQKIGCEGRSADRVAFCLAALIDVQCRHALCQELGDGEKKET